MIKAYTESKVLVCRVNAYLSYMEYKGIQRYPPKFIFADLDLSTFSNLEALERALQKTLKLMKLIKIKINASSFRTQDIIL
jgi:hypothetical protein